ncbi:MAG: hypothetical protein JRI68_31685, partial [Deltaproteobacteria bacterium]|nr:hypothetical protein [Deltaproteobacteria bacterium]
MISGKRWLVGREPLLWIVRGGALTTSLGVLGIACDDATELDPLSHGPVPEVCEPAEIRSCYAGPEGTEGVGICSAGTQTCADHGRAWGPCEGAVSPQAEVCATDEDEDCDGVLTCGETVRSLRVGVGRDEVAWDVGLDGDDNTYLTGFYRDPIDFGGGDLPTTNARRDVFVAKLSPEGEYR